MGPEPYDDEPDYEKPKRALEDDEVYGAPEIEGTPEDEWPRATRRPAPRRRRWLLLGCLVVPLVCCVLPLCALAVAGAGIATFLSRTDASVSGTETLTVEGDGPLPLVVENRVGSVEVRPGADGEVIVHYTKRAYGITRGRAEEELDNIVVNLTQDDDGTVRVEVDTGRTDDNFLSIANHVNLKITAPPALALKIDNNVGNVTVEGIEARSLDVRSNTGSVTFRGSLDPDDTSTYSMETNTGEIELRLPPDTDAEIDARTDVGDLNIGSGFDAVDVQTDDRKGPSVTWVGVLGTGSGDAPLIRLRTNTGGIAVFAD